MVESRLVYDEVFVCRLYDRRGGYAHHGNWVVDARACERFFYLCALERGNDVLAFGPLVELVRALERNLAEFIREGKAKVSPLAVREGKGFGDLLGFFFRRRFAFP